MLKIVRKISLTKFNSTILSVDALMIFSLCFRVDFSCQKTSVLKQNELCEKEHMTYVAQVQWRLLRVKKQCNLKAASQLLGCARNTFPVSVANPDRGEVLRKKGHSALKFNV